MAEALGKRIHAAHFVSEDPSAGAPFRKRVEHVRAWRWTPEFAEGAIVHEPGMVRLVDNPDDPRSPDSGAWVHPSGVVIPG
mgnify:CR=1 FL=1